MPQNYDRDNVLPPLSHERNTSQPLTVSKVTLWVTSDGVQHPSRELADQHVLNDSLVDLLETHGLTTANVAQEVVNLLYNNRSRVRAFLDACNAIDPGR